MNAIFLTRVKVRATPGLSGTLLKVAATDDVATVLAATPTFMDGFEWWPLRHEDGVTGWSARKLNDEHLLYIGSDRFEEVFKFTLRWEGGYVFNPDDPGGATKYGISKHAYPDLDIYNLTLNYAKAIYYEDYWLKAASMVDAPKDQILFEVAVVTGVGRALKLAELSPLAIIIKQYEFYTSLVNFSIFGKGWIRRNTDLARVLL